MGTQGIHLSSHLLPSISMCRMLQSFLLSMCSSFDSFFLVLEAEPYSRFLTPRQEIGEPVHSTLDGHHFLLGPEVDDM